MDDKVNRKRSIFQSNSSLLRGSTLCPASFRPFFTGVGDTRCKADALLGLPRWTVQVGLGGGAVPYSSRRTRLEVWGQALILGFVV